MNCFTSEAFHFHRELNLLSRPLAEAEPVLSGALDGADTVSLKEATTSVIYSRWHLPRNTLPSIKSSSLLHLHRTGGVKAVLGTADLIISGEEQDEANDDDADDTTASADESCKVGRGAKPLSRKVGYAIGRGGNSDSSEEEDEEEEDEEEDEEENEDDGDDSEEESGDDGSEENSNDDEED